MRRNPVRTLVVNDAAAGMTLAAYLQQMLPDAQKALVPDMIQRGGVWVNKWRRTEPDHKLVVRDTLRIATPPGGTYDSPILTEAMIVAQDADWLVVNKPSGWYSQETPWDTEGNLLGAVRRYLGLAPVGTGKRQIAAPARRKGERTDPFLHQVNRLDRETSGLVLFARHPKRAAAMQAAQDEGRTCKRYLTVVQGEWAGPERVDAPIASAGSATFRVDPAGKPSVTAFRALVQGPGWTLVEARPITGRTHQIRVHAAHVGHPLLGDERYGGGKADRRQIPHEFLLHAGSLTVWLPDQPLHWFAPPPAAFQQFVTAAIPDWQAFWQDLNWQQAPRQVARQRPCPETEH
jgi:RluA family pseudouridine synthase